MPHTELPVIDVRALVERSTERSHAARAIDAACREQGFFYVSGHGVNTELLGELEELSRRFFALSLEHKMALRMELGGRAWRGYFGVGDELTSGRPDQKEGLYFGAELPADHPRVARGVPMHGANLFPDVPGFRAAVLGCMDAFAGVGHALLEGMALGLGLDASYFFEHYTRDPLTLFRIFNYPPLAPGSSDAWSVGEHTDYGLLTILHQDSVGGLEVRSGSQWVDAPPIPGTLVCNLGDMLERMTAGRYRSTPHRVRNAGDVGRLSFPFFFDPDFEAEVRPIAAPDAAALETERWDGESVHALEGTYGQYLLSRVARVFPQLGQDVL
jgi:isopenicillin N synthase-like dioxygenase